MSAYFIGCHLFTSDPDAVRREVTAVFADLDFDLLSEAALPDVVENDDLLPDGDTGYGVIISGESGTGWVSVYVADWLDSGVLSKALTQKLSLWALEIWCAEEVHWGYTLFHNGEIADRFADDPSTVAETPDEQADYAGSPLMLQPVLARPLAEAENALAQAKNAAGQFAAAPVDAFAGALGLPFEHVFTGFDDFFENDPDDYAEDFENWLNFRLCIFQSPTDRERLAD